MRRGIQPIAEQSGAKQRTGIVKLLRDSHLETDVNYMALYDAAPPRCFEYDTARSIPNSQRPTPKWFKCQRPTANGQDVQHPSGDRAVGVLGVSLVWPLVVGRWELSARSSSASARPPILPATPS